MAKIKCKINENSTLVKFEAVQIGETFVIGGVPFIKIYKGDHWANATSLADGKLGYITDDTLVVYVKSAELKLTI